MPRATDIRSSRTITVDRNHPDHRVSEPGIEYRRFETGSREFVGQFRGRIKAGAHTDGVLAGDQQPSEKVGRIELPDHEHTPRCEHPERLTEYYWPVGNVM